MKNQSKWDVINKRQAQLDNFGYRLANMHAYTSKGLVRKNQEDSVLLLQHPLIEEFKLLAVADGMGGLEQGEVASNLLLCELIRWFEKIALDDYKTEKKLYSELPEQLEKIDLKIRNACDNGATTLGLVLISKYNTLFLNVGDSRIYIADDNHFEQISIDHTATRELYEKATIFKKVDMRFHKKNNLISSRLGGRKKMLIIAKQILSNSDYKDAYLFSDGVTDYLTDYEMKKLIETSDVEKIAEIIVKKAISTELFSDNLDDNYYHRLPAGLDNATAACIIKQNQKRR